MKRADSPLPNREAEPQLSNSSEPGGGNPETRGLGSYFHGWRRIPSLRFCAKTKLYIDFPTSGNLSLIFSGSPGLNEMALNIQASSDSSQGQPPCVSAEKPPCLSAEHPEPIESDAMISPEKCAALGDSLLRDYSTHLDPLNTNSRAFMDEDSREHQSSLSNASTQVTNSPQDFVEPLPPSHFFPNQASKSFLSHRKGALTSDPTPHQAILKAVASRSAQNGHHLSLSLSSSFSSRALSSKESEFHWQNKKTLSPYLSNDLKVPTSTPSTALFTSLHSPCYFHKRFDDAVNIDRVLEEVAAEDSGMSHSRLIQTATSVREISKQLQRRPIKRAVRTVLIVTKARDNSLVYLTRELTEWLLKTPRYSSDLGVTVYVDAKLRKSKRFNAASLIASNSRYENMLKYWTPDLCWTSPEKFDLVLTLGGDGTILYTSWLFQRIVPPVLSFALGSLGFLTNFEFAAYKTHLDRVMGEQGMRVNLRMRFTCTIFRATAHNQSSRSQGSRTPMKNLSHSSAHDVIEGEKFEVLNELVIDRGPSPYVSNLELYGDDELLTVVQADGCIISTPTGSTAYSLSAGGPLTHPSIPGILLTPICPHTLSFRPMVLSDTLLLKICVPRSSRNTAYASFDGKGRVELRRGDFVQVEAGRYPFPTVVGEGGTGGEWFESVRRALRWNNRGAVQKGFDDGSNGQKKRSPEMNSNPNAGENENEDRDGYDDDDDVGEEEEEEEQWDIDADPISVGGTDSGLGASEGGSNCPSPERRKDNSFLD